MRELPIRPSLAKNLIKAGLIFSVLAKMPGSKRGVRLISAQSLNDYLLSSNAKRRPNDVIDSKHQVLDGRAPDYGAERVGVI
jgi:hypothetical protein